MNTYVCTHTYVCIGIYICKESIYSATFPGGKGGGVLMLLRFLVVRFGMALGLTKKCMFRNSCGIPAHYTWPVCVYII